MGFLDKLRAGREARLIASHPVDDEAWDWAVNEHRILARLGTEDRARLRALTSLFLATKRFVGAGGFRIDEDMELSIAAQASLPLLNLGMAWYRGFTTIYVTADEFSIKRQEALGPGAYEEYDEDISGEAMLLGPVALSWRDVEASGWGEGYNVVIHEMAHKLDDTNGAHDGCPRLHPGMDLGLWRASFGDAFDAFRAELGKPAPRRRKGAREFDDYASESPDEFFAVCCEYFFERPPFLKKKFPEVYSRLAEFFRRDPGD